MGVKGRLVSVNLIPGEQHAGIQFYEYPSGDLAGRYINLPTHTYGTWMCDGKPLVDLNALSEWLENPGEVEVEINKWGPGNTIHFTRKPI